MATKVFKSRELSDVLVLGLPGGGRARVRVDGVWGLPWGTITGAELRDAWILVEDKNEASKLIKEATSSSTEIPTA